MASIGFQKTSSPLTAGGNSMEKLYEQDPYLTQFTATVESCQPGQHGWDVILDQTAFYPEGGGQPYDTGILNGIAVTQVHERRGRIVHCCEAPLSPGSAAAGTIAFPRRFDLMQQHSGEHIVSGFAHSLFGCDNVGFHLGGEIVTIDFHTVLTWEQVQHLEEAANTYIWEDHAISVTYPSPKELEMLDYRSKKELSGRVRIVSFPGADACACCGTHVAASGQVGLVKLLTCQHFRQGVRIELLCGRRALDYLSRNLRENTKVSALLSSKAFETGAAVQRLLAEIQALKARTAVLEGHYFASIAAQYAHRGNVHLFEDGLSSDGVRRLADAVMTSCGGRALCFSGTDRDGYKYAAGQKDGDLRPFTKAMNLALNGRGGGTPGFVQGSVKTSRREIESYLHHLS